MWGRRGFVANGSADVEGERFVSAEELYGGRIADVSGAEYMGDVFAVVRPDGSASVMTAWTVGPCE